VFKGLKDSVNCNETIRDNMENDQVFACSRGHILLRKEEECI